MSTRVLEWESDLIAFINEQVSSNSETGGGRILYLTYSGSDLYGFPSPDSDVDYRGVYVANTNNLLGMNKPNDQINIMDANGNDIELFEVEKFLGLALRMNPNQLEQLASGKYIIRSPELRELRDMFEMMLAKDGIYNGFRGMAYSNFEKFIKRRGDKSIKKYLYVLRGLMAGTYVLRYHRLEPNLSYLNQHFDRYELVDRIIKAKIEGGEKMIADYPIETLNELGMYIEKWFDIIGQTKYQSTLPDFPSDKDRETVDVWLRKLRRKMLTETS